ncbi:hypothetical protein HW115_01405 [Verrucomicrobiaceae bacterium N1E253]|uniref:Uncharacterized protein n=1 Tax=Oceaniferula marina TaxID=2748318 RepID=A0A851GEU6_9BACT|nr:hypothetical protein [Oceaniferula marina]NWK54251.1 hypothetical protein [Oceaniferula marina]
MNALGIFTAWIFGNKTIKNSVFNKLGITAIFAAITGFITWITDLVVSGMDQITIWIQQLTEANWPSLDVSGLSEVGGIANTIFPITETITIFGSLYALWGIVLLIRWVKSFVPTIAN